MTDPTAAAPDLGLIFGDTAGPCGLCGTAVDSQPVAVGLVSGEPVCEICADKHKPGLRELAEGLDQIDDALVIGGPNHRPDLVSIAQQALNVLVEAYGVEEQADTKQAGHVDIAFAIQVAERAMTTGLSAEDTISLVGTLCPDLPTAEFMQAMQEHAAAAAGREADAEAEIPMLQCAKLVLGQAPGPTLGEAVDQLGIDFDQFVGIAVAQAAAAGVDVENLPADVIDECVAAAKTERGTTP